jgi:transcription initiation factor TFIID TATA-box-binding protein
VTLYDRDKSTKYCSIYNIRKEIGFRRNSAIVRRCRIRTRAIPRTCRLGNPKTATLLFRSGTANCTGAKNIEDVRKTVNIIAEKLEKLGVDVYKNPEIIIQNIVATGDLRGELNLTETATGLGLENVEYEPEQFPGLVYRIKEPKVAMLLFSSGKIVCAGARSIEDASKAVERLSVELNSLGLLH